MLSATGRARLKQRPLFAPSLERRDVAQTVLLQVARCGSEPIGPKGTLSERHRDARDTGWTMSQENVELVRAGFAAYNRGDLDALMETYNPEVEFETLLLGTHRGRDAIRLIYEENREALSGYRLDPEELIDAGDQVIAVARVGGAGHSSRIELGDRMAFIFTIKDGSLVRQRSFRSKDEALEAAGLSESGEK